MFFSYILPLFRLGYRRDLEVEDLCKPLKEHQSNLLGEKIAKIWEDECRKANSKKSLKDPSLLKVILRCFGFKLFLYGVWIAVVELGLR